MTVDVIRFGQTYVTQHDGCFSLVAAVVSEARGRRFRTLRGATAYTTRRLREAGLRVATITDVRARRRTRPATSFGDFAA